MQPQRAREIEQAVELGLHRWRISNDGEAAPQSLAQSDADILRAMPRRQPVHKIETAYVVLPTARKVVFKPGILLPSYRLFVWLSAAVRFFAGNALDTVLGRASVQRSAVRFRETLERTGGSFIKIGQQLSLRADILPYAYCAELSKLLDRSHPIPTAQAIEVIERSLGQPLAALFETFDPNPIGSASLACVYQATLKTGERVAVKVRRPGIGRLISADLRALDWLLMAAETLAIIRPGMTTQFRRELSKMLIRELNFRTEARYNEMFRLRTQKDGDGITAPRVFFRYCTDEVLVNELVSGVWMWELMAAVDQNDQEFLSNLRTVGIEPGRVARRLILALHRELLEHLFFHADPHPANLVVLPNSEICFIDFGAVGRFSTESRNTWRELQFHMQHQDVERMVRASINLAGRLPPINVDDALIAMDEIYADWVYAVSSTDAEWWERSSAQTWLRYINVAREYGIPVSMETIQFFRATLLYDSIIVRLDKDVDPTQEWKKYAQRAGKEARSRVQRTLERRLVNGPTNIDYLQIEQFVDMAAQFMFRLQRNVDDPIFQFKNTVGKIAYGLSTLLSIAYTVGVLVSIALVVEIVAERGFGIQLLWPWFLQTIGSYTWVQLGLLVIALIVLRRLLIRLNEPEANSGSRR
jgi:ubiquinone biosynthesis protein